MRIVEIGIFNACEGPDARPDMAWSWLIGVVRSVDDLLKQAAGRII
jgi:hypothetical protein